MTLSRRLTTRVQAIMRSGGTLDDIEAWLEDGPFDRDLDGLELSSEQKAALWLYGWSLLPQYQQRAHATSMLAQSNPEPLARLSWLYAEP